MSGQHTGYNTPDDNAYVERLIRTIIWPGCYDTWSEAHKAIDGYVRHYNKEKIHSALDNKTPSEVKAAYFTQKAA